MSRTYWTYSVKGSTDLIDIFNLDQWDEESRRRNEIIAPNLPAVEPVLEACLRRLCHDTG